MNGLKVDVRVAAGAVALGSIGAGLLGYALGRSRTRREYAARLDEAVEELKNHYTRPIFPKTDGEVDVLEFTLDPNRTRWSGLVRGTLKTDKTEPVPDPLEGLGIGPDGEVLDEEDSGSGGNGTEAEGVGGLPDLGPVPDGVAIEEPPFPFEISEPQFGELRDEGFQTINVTYYAADKTLADDRDQPVPDIVGTVGTLNPLGFGGASGDPNIRYVRNRRLEVDFEILLDRRAYADVVLNYGQPNRRREANPAATAE